MSRKIKPYRKKKGTEKQKNELFFYNNFADEISKHIIANTQSPHKTKNKK